MFTKTVCCYWCRRSTFRNRNTHRMHISVLNCSRVRKAGLSCASSCCAQTNAICCARFLFATKMRGANIYIHATVMCILHKRNTSPEYLCWHKIIVVKRCVRLDALGGSATACLEWERLVCLSQNFTEQMSRHQRAMPQSAFNDRSLRAWQSVDRARA